MRQTGDLGCVPDRGVGVGRPRSRARRASTTPWSVSPGRAAVGAVLMRDVGRVDGAGRRFAAVARTAPDVPRPPRRRSTRRRWEWRDTVGLIPLGNRYLFFGPAALECEAALGFPQPVPRIAQEGWQLLPRVAPRMAKRSRRSWPIPLPCSTRSPTTPHTFLHGDWKLGNLGHRRDGSHRARRLVGVRRGPSAVGARALPGSELRPLPSGTHQGRRDRRVPNVARTSRHRHRAVVGPAARAVPARPHAAARVGEGLRRGRR